MLSRRRDIRPSEAALVVHITRCKTLLVGSRLCIEDFRYYEGRKEYAWSYLSDRTSWHPPSPNVFTPSINNEQKEKEKMRRKKERKPAAIKEWYNYERLTQSKEETEKLWKLFVSLHASTLLNIFAKIILICIFIPLQLQWQWMITISKQKKNTNLMKGREIYWITKNVHFCLCLFVCC